MGIFLNIYKGDKNIYKVNKKDTREEHQWRHYKTLQFSFDLAVGFITLYKKEQATNLQQRISKILLKCSGQ